MDKQEYYLQEIQKITMIKAVIFDMDGVLTDSETYHLDSYNTIMAAFDIKLTRDDFKNLFGAGANQIMQQKFKEHNLKHDPNKYAKLKDKEFRRLIENEVRPLPGVNKLINEIEGKLKICVASSASKENVKLILTGLKIINKMEFYLSSDDVLHTKPSPEIYTKAVNQLNLKPEECIVVEDADLGIQAAKSANIKVIAVTTTLPKERLSQADLIVNSLEDINYETIMKIGK